MTEERGGSASRELFEFAQMRLVEQFRANEALDQKAERVLGAGLGLAGLLIALVTLTLQGGSEATALAAVLTSVPVLAAFASVAVLFYLGYRRSEWQIGPQSERLLELTREDNSDEVRAWLATWLVRSYDSNQVAFEGKAGYFRRSLAALTAEAALFFGSAAVVAIVEFVV